MPNTSASPQKQLIPFETNLPWDVVGALPEMFRAAYGSLTKGLDLQPGQTLLIRGGASTVGLSPATMAKEIGATVVSTTRRLDRTELLRRFGVDHPIVDDGQVATEVRALFLEGVDAARELVGGSTLRDTLRATRTQGTVCFIGALSDDWIIRDFSPLAFIPFSTRLTAYGCNANDLPAEAFDRQLKAISDGRLKVCIARLYHGLQSAREAQTNLESGSAPGKQVVVLD